MISRIFRGRLRINYDELLAATFLLLDVLLSKVVKEVHDAGYSLRVGAFPFRGSQHSLDRFAINDESGRGLLGIISNITSDESRAFLVGSKFAIGDVLWQRANPFYSSVWKSLLAQSYGTDISPGYSLIQGQW